MKEVQCDIEIVGKGEDPAAEALAMKHMVANAAHDLKTVGEALKIVFA